VVFIFGNACKTVFEALIFVFIMHPFDVGDRCVIDGTQVTSRPPFLVPVSVYFPCYVMLCYVMLCYVMLCYVMLCFWHESTIWW
jgi:hypothetical protein